MKKTKPSSSAHHSAPEIESPAVAVIGGGYWGKNLVRNFYNLESLKLVCDKDETILSNYKDQYKGIETCLALADVLSNDDIQGVVIATPAETHFNIARESLFAGKHVFVEKPLVLRSEEGQELIDLARERRRVLMVGHLLQYHPVFIRLKELAHSGELCRMLTSEWVARFKIMFPFTRVSPFKMVSSADHPWCLQIFKIK